jgi:hypothetical protein
MANAVASKAAAPIRQVSPNHLTNQTRPDEVCGGDTPDANEKRCTGAPLPVKLAQHLIRQRHIEHPADKEADRTTASRMKDAQVEPAAHDQRTVQRQDLNTVARL